MEEQRISRHQMFMEIAQTVAKRSTCMRLNVGAVVVFNRRIVSIGYNGHAPGQPHCAGNDCPGRSSCKLTTHAEMNALQYIPHDPSIVDADMYVTDSPCYECFDRLAADPRIGRIFFGTPYRVVDHLNEDLFLIDLDVYRVLPAGYVIHWASGELVNAET